MIPSTPSFNLSTWRYFAQLPHQRAPGQTFSMLDHLRHLLTNDPKLKARGLPGGLNIWLFRNTQKVLEWAGSARDDWTTKTPQNTHKHLIRILEYLDSLQYVQADVPDRPFVNYVNNTIAQVPLLAFPNAVNQKPPDYLHHIDKHMHAVVGAPGVTPQQSQLATDIDKAINNVGKWLNQVRADAKQLVVLDDGQSGAVITAIFQPPQPFEDNWGGFLFANVTDNAAHSLCSESRDFHHGVG